MPELSSTIASRPPADRFRWWITAAALATAIIPSTITQFLQAWDFIAVLYSIFIVPILGLGIVATSIVNAFRRRPLTAVSWFVAFLVFSSASWLLLINSAYLHGSILWAIRSKQYKAEVISQQPDGSLRHVEWFGWGFAGSETSMYLAYDPNNSLAHRNSVTGRFGELLCDVSDVRRLEDRWYAITFYTNTGWDASCDTGQAGS